MQPKFYKNDDNNHCLQCCLLMVHNSVLENPNLSFNEIDELTEYDGNLWTWSIAGAMFLSKKFKGVKIINDSFDYRMFAAEGKKYLEKEWTTQFLESQEKHASINFEKERRLAAKFIESGGITEHLKCDENFLSELLKNNFLIAHLDQGDLYGEHNDRSHYVLLHDSVDDRFLMHDPGLPEKINFRIEKKKIILIFNELIVIPKPGWWQTKALLTRNDPCPCVSGKKNKKCHELYN